MNAFSVKQLALHNIIDQLSLLPTRSKERTEKRLSSSPMHLFIERWKKDFEIHGEKDRKRGGKEEEMGVLFTISWFLTIITAGCMNPNPLPPNPPASNKHAQCWVGWNITNHASFNSLLLLVFLSSAQHTQFCKESDFCMHCKKHADVSNKEWKFSIRF